MALIPLAASLPGLTPREAIADTLYRVVLAFDDCSSTLLESAVTADIQATIPGSSISGIAELKSVVFDRVSKLDTTHFLSNIRVLLEGADAKTAKATCSAMAQHVRPGKGFEQTDAEGKGNKFTSGGRYEFDVVKDEVGEGWKIKKWVAQIVWVDGNPAVMSGH